MGQLIYAEFGISTDDLFEQADKLYVDGASDEDLLRAEKIYEELIRRDPTHFQAMTNLAGIYYRRGEVGDALDLWFSVLVKSDFSCDVTYYNIGVAYLEMALQEDSLSFFKDAIRISMDPVLKVDAFYNLASALDELGRTAEARQAWKACLSLHPKGPWASRARTWIEQTDPVRLVKK